MSFFRTTPSSISLLPSAFFHQPSSISLQPSSFFLLSHYTKNHNPIAEVVIFVDVDQKIVT